MPAACVLMKTSQYSAPAQRFAEAAALEVLIALQPPPRRRFESLLERQRRSRPVLRDGLEVEQLHLL